MRGTEERMDKESEKLVEAVAAKAVEHALEAFGDVVDEKVTTASAELREELGATERRLGVMIEDTQKQVSAVADLVQRDDEKMENHEKRIGRLEDHAGLPVLEPATEG